MEKCKYCGKEFKTKPALTSHISIKHYDLYLEEKLNSFVTIGDSVLDITYDELEKLRKNHSGKCDICGKHETANTRPDVKTTPNKLCIDHDHTTGKFRGFICVQCNRNMGWLDKYGKQITAYLNKSMVKK